MSGVTSLGLSTAALPAMSAVSDVAQGELEGVVPRRDDADHAAGHVGGRSSSGASSGAAGCWRGAEDGARRAWRSRWRGRRRPSPRAPAPRGGACRTRARAGRRSRPAGRRWRRGSAARGAARSSTGSAPHASWARLARRTACFTSSAVVLGASPRSSPVAGAKLLNPGRRVPVGPCPVPRDAHHVAHRRPPVVPAIRGRDANPIPADQQSGQPPTGPAVGRSGRARHDFEVAAFGDDAPPGLRHDSRPMIAPTSWTESPPWTTPIRTACWVHTRRTGRSSCAPSGRTRSRCASSPTRRPLPPATAPPPGSASRSPRRPPWR